MSGRPRSARSALRRSLNGVTVDARPRLLFALVIRFTASAAVDQIDVFKCCRLRHSRQLSFTVMPLTRSTVLVKLDAYMHYRKPLVRHWFPAGAVRELTQTPSSVTSLKSIPRPENGLEAACRVLSAQARIKGVQSEFVDALGKAADHGSRGPHLAPCRRSGLIASSAAR